MSTLRAATMLFCLLWATTYVALGEQNSQDPKAPRVVKEKTLVVWVRLANLTQRGGSALTVETPDGEFDGLVFGEREPRRWMAGSEFFHRTPSQQSSWPAETAGPMELVQMAAVYDAQHIRLYRQGQLYAEHSVKTPISFDKDMIVVIGLRHLEAGDRACLVGEIEDARIYDQALSKEVLAQLRPNQEGGPTPLGWWDFSIDGLAVDRMGRFMRSQLAGKARIEKGKLILPGGVSYLVINAPPTRTRETELWPRWHVTARHQEGVALPYDANGCIYWKGKYHLMYIYQDPKLPHGGHCWGHLSSTDLVNWTYHPPAIVPAPGDPDVGIFSGNAFVNKEGVPMLCWFGINAGVCVATAQDDDLLVWKKHPKNPIVPMPKKGEPGHGVYTVWDPYLWYENGKYWCLLGGNTLPNKKDTLYLMTSPDFVTWKARHPFFEHADLSWTTEGEDCSCPDFFRLGDRHALLCISHKVGARLYLGKFDKEKEKFFPERHIRLNEPGGHFFAPESLLDPKGRRIVWAWVTDPRRMSTQRATGSGVQSLPREIALDADGTFRQRPVRELQALRGQSRQIPGQQIPAGKEVTLLSSPGPSFEMIVQLGVGSNQPVELKVFCAPETGEETVIRYDPAVKKLILDMSRSTLRKDVTYSAGPLDSYGGSSHPRPSVEAPLELRAEEPLKLHVFIDGPMLEVFANERQNVTVQIFPQSPQAQGVKIGRNPHPIRLISTNWWELKPATWKEEFSTK